MNRILFALLLLVSTATAPNASAQTDPDDPWSVRMAESVMQREPDLMDEWDYEQGVVLKGFHELYERTGDERFWNYLKHNIDRSIREDGSIATYEMDDYNVDQVNTGKILFMVYEATGEERYRTAIETLREQLRQHPRTSEGGFWHKQRYPYQLWLDGVYMIGPFLARYGAEYDDPESFDEISHEILLVARYMRDPATGLYYHGWDESRMQRWADNDTGLSKNFWGRGMGWYGMALVDVLDWLPKDHPDRSTVVRLLRQYAAAIVGVQDPVTGLWYQVLDKPFREENYLEASASNMFVYTLVKGVRDGHLNASYLDPALRGWNGVLDEFISVDESGLVNLDRVVSVGGLGGDDNRDGSFEYYMSEPIQLNDNKGVGPFIMAALQVEALEQD